MHKSPYLQKMFSRALLVGVFICSIPAPVAASVAELLVTPDQSDYNEAQVVQFEFDEDGDSCASTADKGEYWMYDVDAPSYVSKIENDSDPLAPFSSSNTRTIQSFVDGGSLVYGNINGLRTVYSLLGTPCAGPILFDKRFIVSEFVLDAFTQEYSGNDVTFHSTLPDINYDGHVTVWMSICSTELDDCWNSQSWEPEDNWTDPWTYTWEEPLADGCYDSARIYIGGEDNVFNKQDLPGFDEICLPYVADEEDMGTTSMEMIITANSVILGTSMVFFIGLILCLWIFRTILG